MRLHWTIAAALSAALALGACSTAQQVLEGKKIDYKSAGTLPPLEVPPDLTSPTSDNRYAVPESPKSSTTLSVYQAEHGRQVKTAGESSVLPSVANMHIERDGSQRWLVVSNETPDQLWDLIKNFWQDNGFLIKVELPQAGIMETDWAENRAKIPQDFIRRTLGKLIDQVYSTPERDKFRTRLERTPDGKGTEVYISHRGMQEVYVNESDTRTMWEPRPTDPGLEAEFLRRLMVRLGAGEQQAKAVMAARTLDVRAQLKKLADGTETLEVFEPFDRAWRRVGLALDRVGFTVEDRNRQKGMYYVRYADPEVAPKEKPGLLSKLAFWRSNDDNKAKAEQYRIVVREDKTNSKVEVQDKNGKSTGSPTEHRILALLHEQLK